MVGEVIMDRVSKHNWMLRGAALAIFLLGFAAGALAPNAYRAWHRPDAKRDAQDHFEMMSERLQLSAEQKTQARQIFDDARSQLEALHKESEPRFEEIRRQTEERLRQLLTPEQFQQFQQMHDAHHGGRHGRPGGDGQPQPDER
jgi:Spy/CpxP family protein refolding chaperone